MTGRQDGRISDDVRSPALRATSSSVFGTFAALARETGAIDLSQGYPDFEPPLELLDAAARAMGTPNAPSGENQYSPSPGHPRLRKAIADDRARRFGEVLDPDEQVVVTCGATEGIAAAILGLTGPDDEVILFEPFYDSYRACLNVSGAKPRIVTLRFPDFEIDPTELEAAFSDRTKLVVVNTPHNPTGKIFTADELDQIGRLCEKHDAYVLSDEVYEHLFYAPHVALPSSTRPLLGSRTLTLGSAGKTFSCTGWKIGWATGPSNLVSAIHTTHQFLTFCAARPLQLAVAEAIESLGPDYYDHYRAQYSDRRTRLVDGLTSAGFQVAIPDGSYFVLADYSEWSDEPRDDVFARWLTTEVGVAAIPPSAFYETTDSEPHPLLRFGFCKTLETLDAAIERLIEHAPKT